MSHAVPKTLLETLAYIADLYKRRNASEEERRIAAYEAWKEKRLHGFTAPDGAYNITSYDLEALVEYLNFHGLQTTKALDAVCCLYDYGFKRGQNYQKAKEKKKAARHAANMKSGEDRSATVC